jgi:ABC-2 type transport system ATP-binding protein
VGVDFEAVGGTIFALLGHNGAGKTTLVRILATLLRADRGRARVAGFDVASQAGMVRAAIGLTGQYAAVDEDLTGRENLVLLGRLGHLRRAGARARADELLSRLGLEAAAGRPVRGYSGGMRRRLDVAASLMARPSVLFLDEPTTGLDPPGRLALWELVDELRDEGTTVVLTTQYLEEADRLADRICILHQGRVAAEGTAAQLKRRSGGQVIEIALARAQATERAARTLATSLRLGPTRVRLDRERASVVVPGGRGANTLAQVLGALAGARIGVRTAALRQPTLDEAFVRLTTGGAQERVASP